MVPPIFPRFQHFYPIETGLKWRNRQPTGLNGYMTNQEFPANEPTAAAEHTSDYVTETAPATHSEVETTYSSSEDAKVKGSFAASTWVALIVDSCCSSC